MPGSVSDSYEGPSGPEWDEARKAMEDFVTSEDGGPILCDACGKSAIVIDTKAAVDRALATIENQRLLGLLARILAEPDGCSLCDSGKPRNPAKGHQPDCPFEEARLLLHPTT